MHDVIDACYSTDIHGTVKVCNYASGVLNACVCMLQLSEDVPGSIMCYSHTQFSDTQSSFVAP